MNDFITNDKIYELLLSVSDKLTTIESNILNLNIRLNIVEEKFNKVDNTIGTIGKNIESKNIKSGPIRNFKKEKFVLDEKMVKKLLERNSMGADYELFKNMYLNVDKELYPIQISNNDYLYWNNGFIKDVESEYIKSVISYNLRYCYLKVNKYDTSKENSDKFIKHQEHIDKLNDTKYLTKLLETIVKRL